MLLPEALMNIAQSKLLRLNNINIFLEIQKDQKEIKALKMSQRTYFSLTKINEASFLVVQTQQDLLRVI